MYLFRSPNQTNVQLYKHIAICGHRIASDTYLPILKTIVILFIEPFYFLFAKSHISHNRNSTQKIIVCIHISSSRLYGVSDINTLIIKLPLKIICTARWYDSNVLWFWIFHEIFVSHIDSFIKVLSREGIKSQAWD